MADDSYFTRKYGKDAAIVICTRREAQDTWLESNAWYQCEECGAEIGYSQVTQDAIRREMGDIVIVKVCQQCGVRLGPAGVMGHLPHSEAAIEAALEQFPDQFTREDLEAAVHRLATTPVSELFPDE